MIKNFHVVVFISSLFFSCSSNTYIELEEQEEGIEQVTFNDHVKNIFNNNCISCHSTGNVAEFRPFSNYELIKEAILNTDLLNRIQKQNGETGLMPPTGRLPQNQINTILNWVEDGLLEF